MHGVHPARRILFYIVRPPSDCHLKAVCFFLQDKVKNTVLSYTKNRKMKKSTICKSKKADFLSFMQNQIQEKKMRNKIKTSANYQSSLRSFPPNQRLLSLCKLRIYHRRINRILRNLPTTRTWYHQKQQFLLYPHIACGL
mgnify:FL=1